MAEHRAAMVQAASVLLRERGAAGVTVDEVCSRAGLTHGGFYAHFASRKALLSEAVALAADQRSRATSELLEASGDRGRSALVDAYLSPSHLDDRGNGCVVAALVGDPTLPAESVLDAGFESALQDLVRSIRRSDQSGSADDALADAALLVGALALARATRGSQLSDGVTRAARTRLLVH